MCANKNRFLEGDLFWGDKWILAIGIRFFL
jgi:hypothetical protein